MSTLLHPALIHGFLEINYTVAVKNYIDLHPGQTEFEMWLNKASSKMEKYTADFALCDFYKAHKHRQTHPFGGLAELWSAEFYDIGTDDETRAQCLVPVNRLAGKFLPGILQNNIASDPADGHINDGNTPMLVLRVPIRL